MVDRVDGISRYDVETWSDTFVGDDPPDLDPVPAEDEDDGYYIEYADDGYGYVFEKFDDDEGPDSTAEAEGW